jgi:hypothetical protein
LVFRQTKKQFLIENNYWEKYLRTKKLELKTVAQYIRKFGRAKKAQEQHLVPFGIICFFETLRLSGKNIYRIIRRALKKNTPLTLSLSLLCN